MPHLLTNLRDKADALAEIERVLDRHIKVGLTPTQRRDFDEHTAWLRRQSGDLLVRAELRTDAATATTTIILQLNFTSKPASSH